MRMTIGLLPILVFANVGFGCGSSAKPVSGTGSLLPLTIGNRWTYQITEGDGTVSTKVQGVTAQVAVGGTGPNRDVMAFRLVTGSKFNDNNGDVSFQAVVSSRVVRFREESIGASSGNLKKEEYWDPSKLRVDESDEHTAMGAEWPESYTEFVVDTPKVDGGVSDAGDTPDAGDPVDAGLVTTMKQVTELWSVAAANDTVVVPAGTFSAIKLKKINQSSATIKYFWFAKGVGKVKEAGEVGSGEQTEELISYMINP